MLVGYEPNTYQPRPQHSMCFGVSISMYFEFRESFWLFASEMVHRYSCRLTIIVFLFFGWFFKTIYSFCFISLLFFFSFYRGCFSMYLYSILVSIFVYALLLFCRRNTIQFNVSAIHITFNICSFRFVSFPVPFACSLVRSNSFVVLSQ